MSLRAFFSRAFAPRPHHPLKGAGRAAVIIAVFAALCGLCLQSALFLLDARLYDLGFSQGRVPEHSEDLVIVGIDEDFMRGLHPFLAPRDRLAKLLQIVANAHPSVVVLDVWLDSRLDRRPNGQDAQLRSALAAVKASGASMLIADLSNEQISGRNTDASQTGSTVHGATLPYFRQAATANASIGFETDPDGVVRRLDPIRGLVPMPLLAARLHSQKVTQHKEDANWQALATRLQHEDMPIAYCGPPVTFEENEEARKENPFPALRAVQLLENPFRALVLQQKVVFIGSTYARGRDLFQTPYSIRVDRPEWNSMYGVELLAQTTQTLLKGAPRRSETTPSARLFTALLTFLLSLAVATLAIRGTSRGVLGVFIVLVGTAVAAVLSARDAGPLWGFRYHPASSFWIAVPLACAAAIAWREWHQARELQHVRGAFEAYVGPQVLKQLSGKMPELGGEVRPVTVLFCDIRGYSALAETMRDDPEGLLRELNGHFSPLVGALQARHAHVDNYVGDLIMALWCEPLSGRSPIQNARDAVAAALDIDRLVNERNAVRGAEGLPPIEVGIGLHSGEAVVGNLGGQSGKDSKIHYTAIGDTVNLASRVESATRQFKAPLLVTREVMEQCGENSGFSWKFVAQTQVKGRQQTVDVFEVTPST